MSIKKGDTLIEVAIAIAVFSLVAIGVVSVVNGSTSAAQNALEVTVTREEIDAQAEAIRFIHNSYITGGQSNLANNDKYKILWNAVIDGAVDRNDNTLNEVLSYNPTTCEELYAPVSGGDGSTIPIVAQKAFYINTNNLGYAGSDYSSGAQKFGRDDAGQIVIRPTTDATTTLFHSAATYPHSITNSARDDQLLDDVSSSDGNTLVPLERIEGIYVIAVADQQTTTIVSGSGHVLKQQTAFYDFYIRTCWFAPGAERPSTVSTVIRLQDPDVIDYSSNSDVSRIIVVFDANGGEGDMEVQTIYGASGTLRTNAFRRDGYRFNGWTINQDGTGTRYDDEGTFYTADYDDNSVVTLYAQWTPDA